uniref:flagellin n=1 Tax=Aureimonas sp. AU12 TaxID=1638161 RepID=UPI00244E7954
LTKAGVQATVALSGSNLAFSSTATGGSATLKISEVSAVAGAATISIADMDISANGLTSKGAISKTQISAVLSSYISNVNSAITKVTEAAANLGSVASRIDMQKSFVNTLMDTIDKGVGNLIDADMSEESTKLQALQVKQSLGVQALSIANQSSQNILRLFQ